MAKRSTKSAAETTKPAAAKTTAVRNTPIPKAGPALRREISHEMIAKRAYEIAMSGSGGNELDNWYRAERELRSEQ